MISPPTLGTAERLHIPAEFEGMADNGLALLDWKESEEGEKEAAHQPSIETVFQRK